MENGGALDPTTEGEASNNAAANVDLQQKSRDAIVRMIKYQLDQYLKHSNANYDIENINYNFLEKTAYDHNTDPFTLVDQKNLVQDFSDNVPNNMMDDPNNDEIDYPDYIKQKISKSEADIMLKFRTDFDLNHLYKLHQGG